LITFGKAKLDVGDRTKEERRRERWIKISQEKESEKKSKEMEKKMSNTK
jgi:hypothetical protein